MLFERGPTGMTLPPYSLMDEVSNRCALAR